MPEFLSKNRRWLAILAVLALDAYFGTYYHLSRRGDEWCRPHNFCGFLYVLPGDREDWYKWHQFCYVVFEPANAVDRAVGGKRYPVRSICLGLSK